ncbi:hypothetical protein [Neobacillus vireti]|uniref:hypothetical protein n=1 Tax=Neobacillus vireti TaxID=220686 RepID=UPI002FFEC53C
MKMNSSTMDEKYTEAIQSLKKINNELFYDELKQLIKDREENIAELNGEVHETIEHLQKRMEQFPVQVSEHLKEGVLNQQIELFDNRMERFDENNLVLEKRISFWHQQYQESLEKTEKLLAEAKGLQPDDQAFIAGESERLMTAVRQLTEAMSEQASALNVKYEVVSERLDMILKEIAAVESRNREEIDQLTQQVLKGKRDIQDKWEEQWKLNVKSGERKDKMFKKWLIGLALGQGVSVLLMVLYFIMK